MSSTVTDEANNSFSNIFAILFSSSVGYDNVVLTLNHLQFSECYSDVETLVKAYYPW